MEEDLIDNIKTFLKSAELVYKTGDTTSSTILYFKAVFSITDYIILKSKGKTPKDHTERFRILQESFSDLYLFLDKNFSIYRDTYSTTIDKETCDKIKDGIKQIIKKYKIPV
jgi:uncharacterized protein (UPF0332 family)